MDDLISRLSDLRSQYNLFDENEQGAYHTLTEAIAVLNGVNESAKPERKKGKWKVCDILDYAQRPSGRKILRCPFCGYLTDEFRSRVDYYHKLTHFCPNCGADMSGEQE